MGEAKTPDSNGDRINWVVGSFVAAIGFIGINALAAHEVGDQRDQLEPGTYGPAVPGDETE